MTTGQHTAATGGVATPAPGRPAADKPRPECAHWLGVERRYCRRVDGVRRFLPGLRCPAHTPRALQGLPEIPPGPGWPASAWTTPSPLSDSRVHDERAIASGMRRSNPQDYRAAQAAEAQRRAS